MLEILLLSLLGLAAAQQPTSGPPELIPICTLDQSSGPPVPGLPDQFSFTIEGNLIERNSSAIMTEFYDGPGNRGRLEFGFNASSGIGIFDYNLGEIFFIPDFRTEDDCRVYPIADNPRFLNFTFGIQNLKWDHSHWLTEHAFVEAAKGCCNRLSILVRIWFVGFLPSAGRLALIEKISPILSIITLLLKTGTMKDRAKNWTRLKWSPFSSPSILLELQMELSETFIISTP